MAIRDICEQRKLAFNQKHNKPLTKRGIYLLKLWNNFSCCLSTLSVLPSIWVCNDMILCISQRWLMWCNLFYPWLFCCCLFRLLLHNHVRMLLQVYKKGRLVLSGDCRSQKSIGIACMRAHTHTHTHTTCQMGPRMGPFYFFYFFIVLLLLVIVSDFKLILY